MPTFPPSYLVPRVEIGEPDENLMWVMAVELASAIVVFVVSTSFVKNVRIIVLISFEIVIRVMDDVRVPLEGRVCLKCIVRVFVSAFVELMVDFCY